jgi:protein ImuB
MFACLYAPSASQMSLLALASSFSPLVEDTSPGVVVFSIVGLSKLIGTVDQIASAIARAGAEMLAGKTPVKKGSLPANLIQTSLAISADPDAAVIAARHKGGLTMIPPGKEADRLSGLPLHVLGDFLADADLAILDTLDRWGIKTLGEMAELPPLGFIARFGEAGERLLRLARGEMQRTLKVREAPETYERRIDLEHDLEHPQALLEPLLFVISSLLQELMEALRRQGLATNRVTLGLRLVKQGEHERTAPNARLMAKNDSRPAALCANSNDSRTLEFPVPVRDPQVILKQLQFDLEAHPPRFAILGVQVHLNPVEPRPLQHGLFVPQAPAPEKLSLTLARLTALVGEGNIGSPELLDTHRPDAFRMRTFSPNSVERPFAPAFMSSLRFAFRYSRPAPSAQVRLRSERPVEVKFQMHVHTRDVLASAGPWKASGDWWTPSPWDREEWDVELSDGGLYRVFRSSREWFLEGVYD